MLNPDIWTLKVHSPDGVGSRFALSYKCRWQLQKGARDGLRQGRARGTAVADGKLQRGQRRMYRGFIRQRQRARPGFKNSRQPDHRNPGRDMAVFPGQNQG
jgi:hypothetical protein